MLAVDRTSGKIAWSYDALQDARESQFHGEMKFIGGARLLVPTDGKGRGWIYSFDLETGKVEWRFEATAPPGMSGGFPTDLILKGNTLIAIDALDRLFAIDTRSGKQLWQKPLWKVQRGMGRRRLSAATGGQKVFATDSGTNLLALNVRNGRRVWTRDLAARASTTPLVVGDDIYLGLMDRRIVRIAARTGRITAALSLEEPPSWQPLLVNGMLIVHMGKRKIAGIDSSLSRVVWTIPTPREWSSPRFTVWRDLILAGDEEGDVVAFRAATGEVAWKRHVGGVVRGIGVADDLLIVGTLQGDVYAIRPPQDPH